MSKEVEENYDFIVLGTGITECVLSGILSMEGFKVLHLDRNDYYGGEGASLSLSQLFQRFKPRDIVKTCYGKDREYCIDLIPKFLMASGEFVDILSNLDMSRYIEFVQIDGSFVFKDGKGICKVPSTPTEAATSSLMGFFEKRRAKNFFQYCANLDIDNPTTWNKLNLHVMSMGELFKSFDLDVNTMDFIGHSLALQSNESYLKEAALITVQKIKLYMNSMLRFGKSPYLYPLYGLGELPQGFARLSAIYGGTYMLNMLFEGFIYNNDNEGINNEGIDNEGIDNEGIDNEGIDNEGINNEGINNEGIEKREILNKGIVKGVKAEGKIFKASKGIICDPSYAPEKVCLSHRVIRAICLLDHRIPSTSDASCQIILPQKQLKRKHDIYVSCLSSNHNVCPVGYFLVQISTIVETANPEQEIAPALDLLGPVLEKFISISNLYEPLCETQNDKIYVSKSLDSSTHFESVCEDVKNIYERIFGVPLKVKARPSADEEQSQRMCDESLKKNKETDVAVEEIKNLNIGGVQEV